MRTLRMMIAEALHKQQMNEAVYTGKQFAIDLKKIVNVNRPTEYDKLLGYTIYGGDELINELSFTPKVTEPIKSASNKDNTTVVISQENGSIYWFGPKNGTLANTCIEIESRFNVRKAKMQLTQYSSTASRNKRIAYELDGGIFGSLIIPLSEYEDVWKFFTNECNLIITKK